MKRLLASRTPNLSLVVVLGVNLSTLFSARVFADCAPSPAGLAHWWPGDGTTNDIAGSAHGTLQNGATFGAGKVGQAFSFDGVNDSVSFGNTAGNFGTNDFTIEFWIKTVSTRLEAVIEKWPTCGHSSTFHMRIGAGKLYVDLDQDAAGNNYIPLSSIKTVNDGLFHHVAFVRQGTNASLHIDGLLDVKGSTPGVTSISNAVDLIVGRSVCVGVDGTSPFTGQMDEISIYNRALSADEILSVYAAGSAGKCIGPSPPLIIVQPGNQTVVVGESATFEVTAVSGVPMFYQWTFNTTNILGATNAMLTVTNAQPTNAGNYSVVVTNIYGPTLGSNAVLTVIPVPPCLPVLPGLVSWWRAEGNVLDANDGNHGVLVENATYGSGRVGQGFGFDGNGDAAALGNPASLQLQNFTFETWIKRSSATTASFDVGGGIIIGHGAGGYNLGIFNDGSLFLGKVGISFVVSGVGVADTNWHHVAVTKSGSSVAFYIDGLVNSTASYDPGFLFSQVAIGARGDTFQNSFLGFIDELAVYNRALSAPEIQAVFNSASVGKCTGPSPPLIIVQPTNQTVVVGQNATFEVTAVSTTPMFYQWTFNNTNLLGATNATLTVTNAQTTNAGNYTVVVTNIYGPTPSSNAVLTVNPTPPCVPSPSGLVGWWRAEYSALEEIAANHGTLVGNVTYTAGRVGQAFQFDGLSDGVLLSNLASLHLQSFTIEAWIKRASTSVVSFNGNGWASIFSYGTGGYVLFIDNNAHPGLGKVGFTALPSTASITDTNFHHVAVTKSGNVVVLFVDGVAYAMPAYDPGFVFTTSPMIGAWVSGATLDNSFNGTIDEIAVYNRALTALDIQSIYNSGASGKCVVPIEPFIVSQPSNTNVTVGANAIFNVVAGGSTPLSYQWLFKGAPIAGATDSSLTISNAQFVNVGHYAVQVTNSAGFKLSSNATLAVVFPNAVVRAGSTNVMGGNPLTVPVTLAANGNENAFGFSLNFSTQRLAFAGVALGSGATGATLMVNSSLANTGRLGIAVAFPSAVNFTPGTQEVVRVAFNSAPLAGASPVATTISFADQPFLRELVDGQLIALGANYSNGTVTLMPTAYEGDVTPRPNGNQAFSATDWLQTGRFVARLDVPAVGEEFQRADSAPKATLGDGQMKVTDWVQAGRYLVGSDPMLMVGGPAGETGITPAGPSASRQLRVQGTNTTQGSTTSVAVMLNAQGDENALGFTLSFDPTGFTYSGVELGSGGGGLNLMANPSQAGIGRLGVLLTLPTGGVLSAGTRELVKVHFNASSPGVFPFELNDQQVTRCVSDVVANELPASYFGTSVTVLPANPSPPLAIARLSNDVVLSWPLWAGDFGLQMTEGSSGWQSPWTNAPGEVLTNGQTLSRSLPIASEPKFFRLYRP